MKKLLFIIIISLLSVELFTQRNIKIFDNIIFFDGYAEVVNEPVPDGVIRHKNSLYAKKLTNDQLNKFGDSIIMTVIVRAACDNYDRLGNVNLALVPKNSQRYIPEEVNRIEIARFITPFMKKDIMPDTVHYQFNVSFLKDIFTNKTIRDNYDIWTEFEIFGVPYAAQKEVKGCEDRIDVFYGSLLFNTYGTSLKIEDNKDFIPLFFQHYLNNFEEGATDEIGKTIKSVNFKINQDLKDVKMILITSNHGANEGGEEYNRRMHYIYFDGKEILSYKPGRKSCEPYRYRNTQGNGIYGKKPMTDEEWQSFSNWCPGDVIDTRIVKLNEISAGEHTFMIEVPEAIFNEKQGYIPVSVFFIGKIEKNYE